MLSSPTSVFKGEAWTGVTFPSWFTCGSMRLAALVLPGGVGASGKPCAVAVCVLWLSRILPCARSSLDVPGFPAQYSAVVQEIPHG